MKFENIIKKYQQAITLHREYIAINSKIANKNYTLAIKYYKELKKSPEGINDLKKLLSSDNPGIRVTVATHLLPFYESEAKAVLKELEIGNYKLDSLSAEYVLKEWENGNLRKYLLSL